MAATPWLLCSALKIKICFSIIRISHNPVEGGWGPLNKSSRPAHPSQILNRLDLAKLLMPKTLFLAVFTHFPCTKFRKWPPSNFGKMDADQDAKMAKYSVFWP